MNDIITFDSDFGPISFEADTTGMTTGTGGDRAKGVQPMSTGGDEAVKSDTRFDKALDTLRAYAGTIQQVVGNLDVTPREVTVEVGLKLKGEAGFVIAKAGAEAEMKIALKWEPRPRAKSSDSE